MAVLQLIVALAMILLAAELFTNGIEWLGHKLNLAQGAVGGVLAAVGTALPETIVPLVAIVLAGQLGDPAAGHEIGVGAILGAPFMLATIAFFATGVGVIATARRRAAGRRLAIDTRAVTVDLRYFFAAYAIAVGAALIPASQPFLRVAAVAVLIVIYARFVRRHLAADGAGEEVDLERLHLHRLDWSAHRTRPSQPRLRVVGVQVLVGLAMIVLGAIAFVQAVEELASGLGIDAALLALVIAPVATELPETFNSLLWVRNGKDTLALGNITGAMVFQSCIPTAIGITLASTAWAISSDTVLAFASAGIAFASTAAIVVPMSRRRSLSGGHLLVGGAFYAAYVAVVVTRLAGVW